MVPYGSTYARAAQGAIIRRYLLCDGGRGAARSRPVRLLKQYNNSKKVQSINQSIMRGWSRLALVCAFVCAFVSASPVLG